MNTERAEILVANTSAMFDYKGALVKIVKGKTTAHASSKVLKGREHLFDPLVVDFDAEVKSEKRGPGRPPNVKTEIKSEKKVEEA